MMLFYSRACCMLLGVVLSSVAAQATLAGYDDVHEFDYVIVGAGTSGLVVANRLSELEHVTVAVIEAGDDVRDDIRVTNPDRFGLGLRTNLDWNLTTTNQSFIGGRSLLLGAGRAIGGTSAINGMTYTRTEDIQIDSWQNGLKLDGWTWDDLLNYYRKSETIQQPNAAQAAVGASFDLSVSGFNGPLKVGWNDGFSNSTVSHILNTTSQNVGLPWVPDMGAGRMRGYGLWPKTVDAEANIRADSARSYYWPYASRDNLRMFSKTLAHRIVLDGTESHQGKVATGVEVTSANGTKQIIKARKEVILSAGSAKSPLLLELSGIGNPDHGIPVEVDLPTVGENFQDQAMVTLSINTTNLNFTGYPQYVSYPSATDIFGDRTSEVAASVSSSIPQYASSVAAASNGALSTSAVETQFRIQHDLLFNQNMPIAEILFALSPTALFTPYWPTLPFSRGSIHISSNDIEAPAELNPNYFMFDIDTEISAAVGNYIRRTFATGPLAEYLGTETLPGLDRVPEGADADTWAPWMYEICNPNNHNLGSAAMLPRELGGVVDRELKVYGTSNVRVVDASVLPQQLVGHLTSTLYALAEKASDLIKESSI